MLEGGGGVLKALNTRTTQCPVQIQIRGWQWQRRGDRFSTIGPDFGDFATIVVHVFTKILDQSYYVFSRA